MPDPEDVNRFALRGQKQHIARGNNSSLASHCLIDLAFETCD